MMAANILIGASCRSSLYLVLSITMAALTGCAAPTLQEAVKAGQTERIVDLVNKGDDINSVDVDGYTPLDLAVHNGQLVIVKLLIEKGANVNAHGGSKWTALHYAADGRQAEILGYLLAKGADPNSPDDAGWTPLHYMARSRTQRKGTVDAVAWMTETLIADGSNVNIRNNDGQSPLQIAVGYGNSVVAEELRKHGGK